MVPKLTAESPARAFITVLSFPNDLETLDSYLGHDRRGERTFVDEILAGEGESWTAPRWADRGDVCFFYYSKRAVKNIERLSRLAEQEWDSEAGLPEYFAHALKQARSLSGKFFAYAFVSGPAFYERPPKGEPRHWRVRSRSDR